VKSDFPAAAWLLAWAIGVSVFLVPILAINFIAAIRSLRQQRVPWPLFVMMSRLLGRLPLPSGPLRSIEGRLAFVSWDQRWLAAADTTATIRHANEVTRELELELDQPIGGVHRVTFKPHQPLRTPYSLGGVRGTLSPAVDNVTPTAQVVVYPARWSRRRNAP
jgi:hypothetical protein